MPRPSPWWRADLFSDRLPALRARARVKDAVRRFFHDAGFDEVETPILQVSGGNETHIAAFATSFEGPGGVRQPLALHTSPEFTCKKLLAAGVARPFTLGPVFRNAERGRLHHPEFTMLEWYRTAEPLGALAEDCAALLATAARAARASILAHGGMIADPHAEPEMLTVVDAFRRHAGVDLAAMLPDAPGARDRLAAETVSLGLRVVADDTWSDLFSKILSDRVEPNLGVGRATIMTRYPASEAALARLCRDDERFAERFELYVCGVEVANAFEELCDPAEQRRRFLHAEAERARIYGTSYPLDEDFLVALGAMPPSAGCALGFDRLVMLATGADHIEDVLWAPVTDLAS